MTLRKIFAFFTVLAAGAGAGFGLKSVLADGIPTPNPLYYSGTLTESGMPVNDPARSIKVNLWTNPTPTTGENAVCTTSVTTPVINGRFRVALDGSCKGGINANPNVFVEVVENGTPLPRAKIGAVPYAVEADHAVNATNLTGPQAQQIVPSGAVVAFDLATCPLGWTALASAQGRTVIGTNPDTTNGLSQRTRGQTLGEETHTMTVGDIVKSCGSVT